MDLENYLRIRRITARECGKAIDVCINSVRNYVHGRTIPNAVIARRIEQWTRGAVTIKDMEETFNAAKKERDKGKVGI